MDYPVDAKAKKHSCFVIRIWSIHSLIDVYSKKRILVIPMECQKSSECPVTRGKSLPFDNYYAPGNDALL